MSDEPTNATPDGTQPAHKLHIKQVVVVPKEMRFTLTKDDFLLLLYSYCLKAHGIMVLDPKSLEGQVEVSWICHETTGELAGLDVRVTMD